ncbi:LutC/YkgG family protein [Puia sp.]|jgi:L-lactate dehydrogenase complex protein LldG|uniref:LutC/YkgG family protein n=1 Tax=Puia sp. TaxID=2045100 RepID=UPI002F3E4691
MNSRDKILAAVKANQPEPRDLPPHHNGSVAPAEDLTPKFITILEAIGGAAFLVSGYDRIATILREQFPGAKRIVTSCPQLSAFAAASSAAAALAAITAGNPHSFETVDLAILPAHFGVAENGACWITESQMIERALPFITQNLALIIPRSSIVPTMHQAYDRIAELETEALANPSDRRRPSDLGAHPTSPQAPQAPYGFATFIAGPSKTADIEQSLVLGAHGPRSLTVFLLDENLSDAGFF